MGKKIATVVHALERWHPNMRVDPVSATGIVRAWMGEGQGYLPPRQQGNLTKELNVFVKQALSETEYKRIFTDVLAAGGKVRLSHNFRFGNEWANYEYDGIEWCELPATKGASNDLPLV